MLLLKIENDRCCCISWSFSVVILQLGFTTDHTIKSNDLFFFENVHFVCVYHMDDHTQHSSSSNIIITHLIFLYVSYHKICCTNTLNAYIAHTRSSGTTFFSNETVFTSIWCYFIEQWNHQYPKCDGISIEMCVTDAIHF